MAGRIDTGDVSSELSRELTLFHITMMGLGMMIGAGVFLGIGNAIAVAGPGGVLMTFAFNGFIAMLTAMSYAELSSAIPRAGGAYNFARIGFGRGTSFVAGWMEWFASSVAGSVYSLTFAIYTLRYLEALGMMNWVGDHMGLAVKITGILIAILFLYINYRGASETGKIGAFFTLGQTLFLIFIGVIGIWVAWKDPSRLSNFKPFLPMGWGKLLVTMGFTYVAFEGYEVIAQAGDETIDPKKNLPLAMLYSVCIVTITYVAVAFAAIVAVKASSTGGMVPWEWIGQFKEKGFGEAVARLMPAGNFFLTLAVIFASTSALNATIYSATRAAYALGRDKMLPPFFAKISKKRKTPWVALLFTGVIVIIVATFLPTMDVASSASIMFLFLFFLVNVCVIKIRLNMVDELSYGFVMPLFPLFPVVAIILQAVLAVWLVHMSKIAWIVAPCWIAAGIVIYFAYSKSRALATEDEILIFEEEKEVDDEGYKVMVSVANPQNAIELTQNAMKFCEAKQATVELLHMVQVPDQVPLHNAEKSEEYMLKGKEGIVEAMLYLAPLFPINTTLRYCRNIARGIVNATRTKKIDTLIIGWHGGARKYGFNLGSTIDPIIERTPSNVVIFKNCTKKEYKRVLVPLAGGPNGAFALEVASIMGCEGAEIVAFTVASGDRQLNVAEFVNEQEARLHVPIEQVICKSVNSRNVVKSILSEADEYDLIVIGCTQESMLAQIGKASIPETIAKRFKGSLVMVKASGGVKKWFRRWI